MARLVITAVTVEGRSHSAVARDYGISRVWVQKLVDRYQGEGPAAFEPQSRRPVGTGWLRASESLFHPTDSLVALFALLGVGLGGGL